MSEQIKYIVQIDDPILNNLVETEKHLQEVNTELVEMVEDYNQTNYDVSSEQSFFNFYNPFFVMTLVGLVLLVFALWFLKIELKNYKPKKIKIENNFQAKEDKNDLPPRITYHEHPQASDSKKAISKGKKIKVVKVK